MNARKSKHLHKAVVMLAGGLLAMGSAAVPAAGMGGMGKGMPMGQQGGGMGMMSGTTNTQQGRGGMMMDDRMKEHMQKMMQQMQKIRSTRDPEERERLIREHMQTMHEAMQRMRQMGMRPGGGMGMKHQGGAMQNKGGMSMEERMQHMEQRMQMMQSMMEQMMQNRMMQDETQQLRRRHDHRKMK